MKVDDVGTMSYILFKINISMAHKYIPKKNDYKQMTFIIFEILLKSGVQLKPTHI